MAEWQILDSDGFPEIPPDGERETPPSHSRWRWVVLASGVLAFLLVVGYTTLRERQVERHTAIRDDLEAIIFEEETQQFLGNTEQAVDLMVPYAPASWQQAYQQTFSGEEERPPPGSARLKDIDFDGTCAVVTVTLINSEQVRVYCLHGEGWRRAAVSPTVWGNPQDVIHVTDDVQLRFRLRDQAFGETLARDLNRFFTQLDQWTILETEAAIESTTNTNHSLEIIIEPQDLHTPLIADEEHRIVINSPGLVPFDGTLSGELAVRLALAEALIGRTGPFNTSDLSALPGSDRFFSAAQTVAAMHLLLPPEAQADLVEHWRSQLDGQWVSPFFAELLNEDTPDLTQQVEAAAHLTADYIYRSKGLFNFGLVVDQMPLVNSWDRLFQPTIGHSLVELEAEAAHQAHAASDSISLRESDDPTPFLNLPLAATLLRVDKQATPGHRAYVEIPNYTAPLLVELPTNIPVHTPDGTSIPSNCTPPDTTLNIDGNWLEAQRRLQATHISASEIAPLTIEPAPADTIAYLVLGEPSRISQAIDLHGSYVVNSSLPVPQTLVALRQNGDLKQLTGLNENLRVFPLPIAPNESVHFLFKLDLPACGRSWFIHYDTQQGVTGRWLGPQDPVRWMWRPDRQDILFFQIRTGGRGYDIYKSSDTLALDPVSRSFGSVEFLGWNIETGRPVVARPWFDATYIDLLDLRFGNVKRVHSYFQPLLAPRLNPPGNWLSYVMDFQRTLDTPPGLGLLDLSAQKQTILIQVGPGEGLGPPVWSLYLNQPTLAVLAGPLVGGNLLRSSQLLIVSPDRPEAYEIVTVAIS